MVNDSITKKNSPGKFGIKHKIALIVLFPLLIAAFLSIVSLRAEIYSRPQNFKFKYVIMKIKKIFIPNIRTAKIDPVSPKARIAAIKSAIDTYLLNTNQYPVTLNDLITDSGLEGWCGPYLKPSQLNDPWGRLYIYNVNGGSYILKSYGKDGKPGGKGDSADTFNY